MDVDLKLPSFIDGRIKQGEQTLYYVSARSRKTATASKGFEANLVSYVWSGVADVSIHLSHNTDVLVAI